ncbi:lactonase family protein [Flagellimonas onchidii]|uniref:lactonase family protein n=1 Tax=Flagellimonas onchidii TaxID=2562684 RepID=UPI0010A63705|nr:lactonase family protein [Allomuricauda onchidii]
MKKNIFYALLATLAITCVEQPEKKPMHTLFVGTYTDGDSEGIYKFTFDTNTGELMNKKLAAVLPNPSFIKIAEDKKNLYAVHETADFDSLGGGVSAFKLKNGQLELLNSMGTEGKHPCHVALSGYGFLATSNYSGGNVSVFALNQDGSLQSNPQMIDHKVLDTTKTSHAHMAKFVGNDLFVADLGLDAVKRYSSINNLFVPGDQVSLDMVEGAGPRHFTFSKDGKLLYVINELNSTITVLKQKSNGFYKEIETVSTLDPSFEGKSYCADIHLSPNGKFLYGSNRGENTIVIFAVHPESGKLSLVGRESVRGDWPRNFTIDPSGNFLLVANQRSNNITIYKRNPEQGTLEFLKEEKLSSPVCLEFLE